MEEYKTDNSDLEDIMYIHKEVIALGSAAFKDFNAEYAAKPSCKEFIQQPGELYQDCLLEKVNCCYEQIKAKIEHKEMKP